MTDQIKQAIEELDQIQTRVFNLANSFAGNQTGIAAVELHGASNHIGRAIEALKRGNPNEPIPAWAIAESMLSLSGLFSTH